MRILNKLNLSNFVKVALWELIKGVRSPSFLIMTLLLPAIMGISAGVGFISSLNDGDRVQKIAVMDQTESFFSYLNEPKSATTEFHNVPVSTEFESLLEDQGFHAVLVFSASSIEEGLLPIYVTDYSKIDEHALTEHLNQVLARYRLEQLDLALPAVLSAIAPVEYAVHFVFKGEAEPFSLARMIVPMIAAVLLIISTAISGQVLMYGVIKEKRNRVVEILLSSISSIDLFLGKIAGYGLMSLLQITIWVSVAALVVPRLVDISDLTITGADLFWPLVFFLGGYFMIASIFAAIGATMKEAEEGSQLQGLVVLIPMFPLFVAAQILDAPNVLWIRIMSHVPPFIPSMVILRMAVTEIPLWERLSTLSILLVATIGLTYWGSRIFQGGILQYDRNLNLKDIRSMFK